MYDRDVLMAMLKRHEGFRESIYFDSENILTVGVGHALGYRPVSSDVRDALVREGTMDKPFSATVLQAIFEEDAAQAEKELRTLAQLRGVDFDSLSDRRQMALIDMAFNLGTFRLGQFMKMWAALAEHDYDEAAGQALDSKWARQVGPRAVELADMLRVG